MKNPFKGLKEWWSEGREKIAEEQIRYDAQNSFNIERRRTGLGEEYDVILYLGVCITTKEDSKRICDKLAELRQTYIQDKLNALRDA